MKTDIERYSGTCEKPLAIRIPHADFAGMFATLVQYVLFQLPLVGVTVFLVRCAVPLFQHAVFLFQHAVLQVSLVFLLVNKYMRRSNPLQKAIISTVDTKRKEERCGKNRSRHCQQRKCLPFPLHLSHRLST